MATDILILFAHGARDAEWARPVEAVAKLLRDDSPNRLVKIAYLEFMKPTLSELMANLQEDLSLESASRIYVLPFFIAQGGHLRKELPEILESLRTQYPGQTLELLPPLGELPTVQKAMAVSIANLVS